jgi:hypothetical protein
MKRGEAHLSIRQYVVWRRALGLGGASITCVEDRLRRGVIRRVCPTHVACPERCRAGRLDPKDCDQRWAADLEARARARCRATAPRGRRVPAAAPGDGGRARRRPRAPGRLPVAPLGAVGTTWGKCSGVRGGAAIA